MQRSSWLLLGALVIGAAGYAAATFVGIFNTTTTALLGGFTTAFLALLKFLDSVGREAGQTRPSLLRGVHGVIGIVSLAVMATGLVLVLASLRREHVRIDCIPSEGVTVLIDQENAGDVCAHYAWVGDDTRIEAWAVGYRRSEVRVTEAQLDAGSITIALTRSAPCTAAATAPARDVALESAVEGAPAQCRLASLVGRTWSRAHLQPFRVARDPSERRLVREIELQFMPPPGALHGEYEVVLWSPSESCIVSSMPETPSETAKIWSEGEECLESLVLVVCAREEIEFDVMLHARVRAVLADGRESSDETRVLCDGDGPDAGGGHLASRDRGPG